MACDSNTQSRVSSFWFRAGTSISFNIQGSITANQFINDDSNIKQYSMLERGSTCYMPKSSYTGWIFIGMVFENHPTLADTCYVSRIITTSHLETCSGSPPGLETFVTFGPSGTFDEIPKMAKLVYDSNNLPERTTTIHIFTLTSAFTYNSIDEDFMEMLILKVQNWNQRYVPNTFFTVYFDFMRRAYHKKVGLVIKAGEFIRKNIVDGLRGFHLNPDPTDSFGSYMDYSTFSGDAAMTKSINYHFYLSKPNLMTSNDVYLIKMKTEPVELNTAGYTMKELEYGIKVERDVSNNLFKLSFIRYISSTPTTIADLSFPYTGINDDWIHFGATIGYAVLYFTSATNGKFKRREGIHAWVSGNQYHKEVSMLEDDTTSSLYPGPGEFISKVNLIVSLQAFSDSGMTILKTTNDFGLRLWDFNMYTGSYPEHLITTSSYTDGRCFYRGSCSPPAISTHF